MKTELKIKRLRRNKPDFSRQQSSLPRLGNTGTWRHPRGKSSKVRLSIAGHKPIPSIGYGSPADERFLNRYGLEEVLVSNVNDIKHLNANHHAIVLSRKLGLHKKLMLLEKIKEHKVHVMNVRDIDLFISNIKDEMKKRKEEKKSLLQKKKEVSKKKEEKVKEKQEEKKEEVMTQEEKVKQEKEEQRKVLEKKQTS